MAVNPLNDQDEILLVRQRHEAKKMGLHWDYRFVKGEHAFSWATKKEMPEPGRSIVLFEQPVHDRAYAMSERIEIPDGNYGAGVTTLDWARKAKVESHEDGTMVIHANGERFLLKKLDPAKYGAKAWLFKNLTEVEKKAGYLEEMDTLFPHTSAGSTTPAYVPRAQAWTINVSGDVKPRQLGWVEIEGNTMSNKYLEKIAKIAIDPKNKGKLHKAMGRPEGEKLSTSDEEAEKSKAKKSGNVKLEREAQFAINAKKWHHKGK